MRKNVAESTEGHRLLRARVAKMKSQQVVADELGVRQMTVWRWLQGGRPDMGIAARMYAAFGWHPWVWLTPDDVRKAELHSTSIRRADELRKRRARSVQNTHTSRVGQ